MSETDQQTRVTTYSLSAERLSPRRTRVDTGSAELVVGHDANPVEYFFAAIVGCINSTGTMVARDMDITLDGLTVEATGDVDYAAYRGESTDTRPGLQSIEIEIDVETDESPSTVATWLEAIENRCPITDNVENTTPLHITLTEAN